MYRRGTNDRFRRNEAQRKTTKPTPSTPAPPLGHLIKSLSVEDLVQQASSLVSTAKVTNTELFGSYNWLDGKTPAIIVPGAPPKWTPRLDQPQLNEDEGIYYRDKNASRFPSHPMEPAVRAILALHPKPIAKRVDVVACGSTLGNLLRFVRGEDRSFRMLVENVDGVVHLIRRENSPQEIIHGIRGFGHTFPEAYTSWDSEIRGSVSHQRIVRYDFGGLNYIVRHEGDGYLPDKTQRPSGPSKLSDKVTQSSLETVVAELDNTTLGHEAAPQFSSNLQVEHRGFDVPQSAVFDLKTRSVWRKGQDFLSEELPRLWVAQIPNFVLAYHQKGIFTDIEIMDASSKIQEWESTMSGELSKLAALIHHIIDLVLEKPSGKLELHRQEMGKLEVREQTLGLPSVLSEDAMKGWKMWLNGEDATEDGHFPEKDGYAERDSELSWDDDSADFTACSAECGYCGHCSY